MQLVFYYRIFMINVWLKRLHREQEWAFNKDDVDITACRLRNTLFLDFKKSSSKTNKRAFN